MAYLTNSTPKTLLMEVLITVGMGMTPPTTTLILIHSYREQDVPTMDPVNHV